MQFRQLLDWLGDSDAELQLALEAAELGIWHLNPASGEAVWSAQCRALLGVGDEAPASLQAFMTAVHPHDRAAVTAAIDTALQTQQSYSAEFRVQLPGGGQRWLHSFGRARYATDNQRLLRLSGVVRDITSSRTAAEALARQKQEFLQLMQAAPFSVAKFDRNMCYLALNQSYSDVLGVAAPALIGRCHYELFAQYPPHWRALHQRGLAGETLSGDNEELPRPDGLVDIVNWHIFPWFDDRGEVGGIVWLCETLTKQLQLENRGRLWAHAFAHNSRGMSIVDPTSRTIVSANAAYEQLSGYSQAELTGRSVFTLYPQIEHVHLRVAAAQADSSGSATVEVKRLHKDGSLIPTLVDVVCVRDTTGTIQYRLMTVTDLRELANARTQIQHHEAQQLVDQRFKLLAQSAPIGILLSNPEGTITYANPAWLAITALSIEQALDSDWFDLVHEDDRERVALAWQRAMKGVEFDMEFRYRRASGETRWVRSHASELKDSQGNILGWVRTSLDITDRLLERAAADRFHSQLRSLAERLENLRETERSDLAHDLRHGVQEDLRAIEWEINAGLGKLETPEDPKQPAGEVLRRVATLTAAAREQLRHLTFALAPPGVDELGFAGALQRYVDELADRDGLQVTLQVPPGPLFTSPRIQNVLFRVVQEGIDNAVQHARASRIEVNVSVLEGVVRVRVIDNGIGIGDRDRIKPGCFGLLRVSERLSQIGGTLRTFGVANQGTTFEISAPLDRRRRRAPATSAKS